MHPTRWLPILVAEISWRLSRFASSLQLNRNEQRLSALDSVVRGDHPSVNDWLVEHEKYGLAKLLIKYPYWLGGHQAFSRLALKSNDIAAAYACAQAMLKLSHSTKVEIEASYILARCYMRRGVPEQALPLLQKVYEQNKARFDVAEDLAAAYIGAGNYSKATEIFARIPSDLISAEGLAAKSFAQSKVTQNSDSYN